MLFNSPALPGFIIHSVLVFGIILLNGYVMRLVIEQFQTPNQSGHIINRTMILIGIVNTFVMILIIVGIFSIPI